MKVTNDLHLKILKRIEEHLATFREKSNLQKTKGFYFYESLCPGKSMNQFAPSFIVEFGCSEGVRCDSTAGIMLTLNDILTKTMLGYAETVDEIKGVRRLMVITRAVSAPLTLLQIGDSMFCMTHVPGEAASAILLAIAWEFERYPARSDFTERQALNEFFTAFKLLDRKFFEALNVANPCTFASAVVQSA